MLQKALVIDVGGHRVKAGIVEPKSTHVNDIVTLTYPSVANYQGIDKASVSRDERVQAVLRVVEQLYTDDITHFGLSTTDIVDFEMGKVIRSTSKSYEGVVWPLELKRVMRPNTLVIIQNDTKCGALAEYELMKRSENFLKSINCLVRVNVGSGIGSGIVMDGKLVNGAGFVAGEIAYIPYKPQNGFDCEYGRGCVEKHASSSGIIRRALENIANGTDEWSRRHRYAKNIGIKDIGEGVRERSPIALDAVKESATALGTAIYVILNLLGPDVVTIGGGVIDQIPEYFDFARDYVYKNALPPAISACKIMKSQRTDLEIILLGAAYLSFERGIPLSEYMDKKNDTL